MAPPPREPAARARIGDRPTPSSTRRGGSSTLADRFRGRLEREPKLVPEGSTVLVAFSGGPDSTALLHLLVDVAPERRLRLVAAHFDHGARPGSAEEAEIVASRSRAAGVPCRLGRQEALLERTQAAFRAARYAFLREVARESGAERIATAHQADDQAETVLHRIVRGTGLRGLAGIPARRGLIVRPLLSFRRAELRAYLEERDIPFLEDPSNRDRRWTRARIRHEAIPALERATGEEIGPRLVALARRARRLDRALDGAARELLEGPLEAHWEREAAGAPAADVAGPGRSIRGSSGPSRGAGSRPRRPSRSRRPSRARVDLLRLRSCDPELQARVVRLAARRLGGRPRRGGTRAAVEFIKRGRSGGGIDLADGLRLWREFDHLWVGRPRPSRPDETLAIPDASPGTARVWVGGRPYRVAWGRETHRGGTGGTRWAAELPLRALRFPLGLRGPRPGDRIRLGRGGRKLKRLFNEERVPRSERPSVPVLHQGGELLWVGGIGRAKAAHSPDDEERFFIGISDA